MADQDRDQNPTPPPAATAEDWGPIGKFRKRLGISKEAATKIVREGLITVRRVPGQWPQVRASELERFINERTYPPVRTSGPSAA